MGKFQKGNKASPGRPKGVPNKSTQEIREAFTKLLEDNLDNMTEWIVSVAKKDPQKAFELMLKMSEYILPKKKDITSDGKSLDPFAKLTDAQIKKIIDG